MGKIYYEIPSQPITIKLKVKDKNLKKNINNQEIVYGIKP